MKIISSQEYLNWDVVEDKMAALEGSSEITLQVYDANVKDLDGNDLYVLFDGHHKRAAAIELGIEIKYEVVRHPEDLEGVDLLEQGWIDSDWRYIDTDYRVW